MEWKNKQVHIQGKVGKPEKIIFAPAETLPQSILLKSSCGCSTPKLVDGQVVVNYTPGSVPRHLIQQGFYKTKKSITVIYEDDTKDILEIFATIKK